MKQLHPILWLVSWISPLYKGWTVTDINEPTFIKKHLFHDRGEGAWMAAEAAHIILHKLLSRARRFHTKLWTKHSAGSEGISLSDLRDLVLGSVCSNTCSEHTEHTVNAWKISNNCGNLCRTFSCATEASFCNLLLLNSLKNSSCASGRRPVGPWFWQSIGSWVLHIHTACEDAFPDEVPLLSNVWGQQLTLV